MSKKGTKLRKSKVNLRIIFKDFIGKLHLYENSAFFCINLRGKAEASKQPRIYGNAIGFYS